ncbi:hypothetical protein, partial [Piscirickettsia litoralis]|uniref:hypothetical protein n=1 Tax=Piscirickettsia litoralis TaxID=1891921 RepID=UPI001300CC16
MMKKMTVGLATLLIFTASSTFAYPIVKIVECQALSNKVYIDNSYENTQGESNKRCSQVIASALNDNYSIKDIRTAQ